MADLGASRRAERQAKINAMPLGKRIGMMLAGAVAVVVAGLLVSLVVGGDVRVGFSILMGLAAALGLAYQYLWVPSRS